MASIRTSFEKEIKNKLNQKSSRAQSEETVLLKNFKFFDLNQSGTVDFDEFLKAIEKIGVQTFNKGQLEDLFNYYDSDKSGSLDYKEFAGMVLGGSVTKSEKRSGFSAEDIDALVERIKGTLNKRGPGGILGLGKQFLMADKNKNRDLEKDEFTYALRDYGCGLSPEENEALFDYFDKDKSGAVNYDEFLYSIRGKLNDFRKKLVLQAFDIIDEDHSGELTIDDLKDRYNAKAHPEVKQGKKTEEEVLREFLKTFENLYDYHRIDDDKVTKDEFLEYYAFVAASVDNDQYFELMMNNTWRMNEGKNKNWDTKGWSGDYTSSPKKEKPAAYKNQSTKEESRPATRGGRVEEKSENASPKKVSKANGGDSRAESNKPDGSDAVQRVRAKLNARGAKGWIGLQRQFKIMDDDNDKSINLNEFSKAMKDFGCGLNNDEIKAVYKEFDVDNSGVLSIDEFVRGVRGEMNNFRKAIVKQAFKILDRSGDGVLQISDIKGIYNAKNHPDVKSGKRTEDEILGEFLETFEAHHNLKAGSKKDQTITVEEFVEYYNNISSNIDNDKYFENMMANSYKLWVYDPKYKEYAPTQTGKGWSNTAKQTSNEAPFGTTANSNDWSTSNRPSTARATKEDGGKKVERKDGAYTDDNLLELFRTKIASRGARGMVGLQRLFKIIDDDNSKVLDYSEFSKACNDFRIDYQKDEIKRLFGIFDTNKSGDIDIDEFLRAVRGPMAPARVQLVKKAFSKLDNDNSGIITMDEIRSKYNAKAHPDVKTGKKTEDEILMEFLDTFEIHHSIHNGDNASRDGKVSLNEFLEYYNNISSSIDDDKYFELMITNAWNFSGATYQKGWRGEI